MATSVNELSWVGEDVCLVRSIHTEAVNHAPGVTFFLTGSQVPGRPSLGAWVTYGLGSEAADLPAFVVMTSSARGRRTSRTAGTTSAGRSACGWPAAG